MRHRLFLEKNESSLECVLSLFALLKSKFRELGPAGSGSMSRIPLWAGDDGAPGVTRS